MAVNDLSTSVGGRLFPGVPFAYPCFSGTGNNPDCVAVEVAPFRSDKFGTYINTQWETCQCTGSQCLLDSSNPADLKMVVDLERCELGSVPGYFVDVRNSNDVVAAFKFSGYTGIPLVIKNTGHDYKGRSSAPNSLELWMSYHPEFVPEGCVSSQSAVTFGWAEAFEFADAHNITVVGGSDRSVGVVGGWLQGGGHGVLSNTMGLGVDRVLQFKVVTPDGEVRVADASQNQDLFFALRGGFWKQLRLHPHVTLQAVIIFWSNSNRTLTAEMWNIMVDNGLTWAADGWGGFSLAETAILVKQALDPAQAATSVAPLVDFGHRLQEVGVPGAQTVVTTFPSFLAFFNAFTLEHPGLTPVSRLISKRNFQTHGSRTSLVAALQATNDAAPGMLILLVPPASYKSQGGTSVTDAWRSSVYHVTATSSWAWNATISEKRAAYRSASNAIENLRRITPDAAYLNEADVYEPNHEVTFWGSHYQKLLRIKRKYDSRQLLDCWQCVGWNSQSPRFSCYLSL
ncbi:hypothetical protein B0H13DRAFT_2227291 [Mycena leptocephala]|nr:hypothetical protein B0H13DRAFT_2227291 [Mycena leptocephala]